MDELGRRSVQEQREEIESVRIIGFPNLEQRSEERIDRERSQFRAPEKENKQEASIAIALVKSNKEENEPFGHVRAPRDADEQREHVAERRRVVAAEPQQREQAQLASAVAVLVVHQRRKNVNA